MQNTETEAVDILKKRIVELKSQKESLGIKLKDCERRAKAMGLQAEYTRTDIKKIDREISAYEYILSEKFAEEV